MRYTMYKFIFKFISIKMILIGFGEIMAKAGMLEMKLQNGSQLIWTNQAARFTSLPSQELYRRMKSGGTLLNLVTRYNHVPQSI